MNNRIFIKAVRLLAHPLCLGAVGLMLANDFILKPLWPSWLTGKLSDFAGLFFLPFLLAALLALVMPGRRVGWLAFGITGAGFTLLKLDPGFNAAALGLVHSLTGLQLQARVDPSDLLALLSLLPAAWLWRGQPKISVPALRWRLLALPLAALVTLADAAAPDLGIACLAQPAGAPIEAATRYLPQSYQSQDGGLTWQPVANKAAPDCAANGSGGATTAPAPLTNPADGTIYRFIPGQGIDRSKDGGQNWHSIYSFTPLTEPDQVYRKLTLTGNISFGSTPYAALFDSNSGNLVVAMGLDGVLVRQASGVWTWVTVGPYQHDSLQQAGGLGLLTLLFYQIFLAILVGLGWIFTRSAHLMEGRAPWIWAILGWIALGIVSLLVVPDIVTSSYTAIGTWIALAFMSVATLVALLVALIRLKGRFFGMLPSGLLQAVLLAAACLLPYALWGMKVITGYSVALAASTGLVAIFFILFSLGKRVK